MATGTAPPRHVDAPPEVRASFAGVLVLTAVLGLAAFMVLLALGLLIVQPQTVAPSGTGVNQQVQSAKSGLYILSFAVLVPVVSFLGPRLADTIAIRVGPEAQRVLALLLGCGVCCLLLFVKLSGDLPWGDGVGTLLAVMGLGTVAGAVVHWRVTDGHSPRLAWFLARERWLTGFFWALVFGVVLTVVHVDRLAVIPVVLGVAAAALALRFGPNIARWTRSVRRPRGIVWLDVVIVLVLLLAVPDVVIYHIGPGLPNAFYPPGVYQFQQDWIIGPANQLQGGGTVLVDSPVSQYGVGMLYFLNAWFHVAPIGYGTFGLLDGLLTALVYVAGYGVVRLAGVGRALAAAGMTVAVLACVYGLAFPVGSLPEQGPLRFGVPMALIVLRMAGVRWRGAQRLWRAAALVVLGVAAVWALEALAYTAFTYVVMVVVESSLRREDGRRRWACAQLGLGVVAIVTAHVLFALATLAGSGHLPVWSRYLAYLHSLLLGGKEGSITYGFDHWAPGLAVGVAAGLSLLGLIVLILRSRAFARARAPVVIAIAGVTAYEIAVFSYTQNRSSTYLVPYVALPLVLAGVLWLSLLWFTESARDPFHRGGVLVAGAVATVLVATAWPIAGSRFSESALAHAVPGRGLGGSVSRLWHNPVIDPRARTGESLLATAFPSRRAIVLLPTAQDLGIEVLMRAHKINALFIGDPIMDDFIPHVWVPEIGSQVKRLRAGDRILTQRADLVLLAQIRRQAPFDPFGHTTGSAVPTAVYNAPELVWTLQQIDLRYRTRPVVQRGDFVVLEITGRR